MLYIRLIFSVCNSVWGFLAHSGGGGGGGGIEDS